MHTYHQDSGVQGPAAVYGQVLQGLHHLRLLHYYQLAFGEHRISSGSGHDSLGVGVSPIEDALVKVPLAFIQGVLDYSLAHHVRVERLVSHKEIHRLEYPVAGLRDQFPTQ